MNEMIPIMAIVAVLALIYGAYWLNVNYKPFIEYATEYPSATSALEYLGYMKRKDKQKENEDE